MSSHLVDLVMHHIDPGVSIEGTSSRRNRRYRLVSPLGNTPGEAGKDPGPQDEF
jgi:hypothetical protein